MVSDSKASRLVSEHGLQIINVAWEDTGRYAGSSVGPNISDVTIQVQYDDPVSGAEVDKLIGELYRASPEVVARAKAVIAGNAAGVASAK